MQRTLPVLAAAGLFLAACSGGERTAQPTAPRLTLTYFSMAG